MVEPKQRIMGKRLTNPIEGGDEGLLRWRYEAATDGARDRGIAGKLPDQRDDADCLLSGGGDSTQHTWSLSSATERQAATGKSEAGFGLDGATPVIRARTEQRAADRERLAVPRCRSGPPDPRG